MKTKKYTEQTEVEGILHAGEQTGCYVAEPALTRPAASPVDKHYLHMQEFVRAHYGEQRARELEAQNYMIGMPFECDVVETEEDWERIEREAEESGLAIDAEVETVLQRWNSL